MKRFDGPSVSQLKRFEKVDEIVLLLVGKAQVEPILIKVHHVLERRGHSIVEVGSACGKSAQDRAFELADIRAFTGYERSPGIRRLHHGATIA